MLANSAISGVVFADLTGGGFSSSNVPQGGVQVELFRDANNDGVLDAGDGAPIATTTSATGVDAGAYSFSVSGLGLADGTYFVEENLAANPLTAGDTQTGGPTYYTVIISGGNVTTPSGELPTSPTNTTIDNFADPTTADTYFITNSNPNPTVFNESASGALGGSRNVLINVLNSTPDPISAEGSIGAGAFDFGTDTTNPGTSATLQYDGTTSDVFVSPNSLSNAQALNVDLTNGGANSGIHFSYNFLQSTGTSPVNVTINATSAGGTATYSMNVNQDLSAFDLYAAFSDFTTTGTFTWTKITSLTVVFNNTAVPATDFAITGINATGFNFANYAAPANLSGNVYVDVYNSGVLEPGDPPIGNVEIILTGTTDLGASVNMTTYTAANGTYSFDNLRPGVYDVRCVQPLNFIEGNTTAGTINGVTVGVATPNLISTVTLPANADSIENNFGEVGLTPAYVSKRTYLYPIAPVVLTAVNPVAATGDAMLMLAAAASGASGGSSSSGSTAAAVMVPLASVITNAPTSFTPSAAPAAAVAPVSAPVALPTVSAAAPAVAAASETTVSASPTSASNSTSSTGSASSGSPPNSGATTAGAAASAAVSASSLTPTLKKNLLE